MKILYATNVSKIDHILPAVNGLTEDYKYMVPWIPVSQVSMELTSFSIKIDPRANSRLRLRNELQKLDNMNNYIGLGTGQYFFPITNFLNIVPNYESVSKANALIQRRVKKWMRRSNLAIVVADILPLDFLKNETKVATEMRIHNPQLLKSVFAEVPYYFPRSNSMGTKDDKVQKRIDEIMIKSDFLLTYSKSAAESYISSGFPRELVRYASLIPWHSIEVASKVTDLPTEGKRKNRVLFIGRDERVKGLDLAIQIIRDLNLEMTVVGSYSKEAKEWLSKQSYINFKGYLNKTEMMNLYKETSIVIIPGIESFGLSVIEALEHGCLVVGSKYVGALNWISKSDFVFVAEHLDYEHMKSKLEEALNALDSKLNLTLDFESKPSDWHSELKYVSEK